MEPCGGSNCADLGFRQFIFWAGGALYIGSAVAPSELHSHHAIQLSLGLRGKVQFKSIYDADWIEYDGAVIPPDLPHTFQAPGRVIAHIFCEPESTLGRRIISRFGSRRIATLPGAEAHVLSTTLAEAYFADAPEEQLIQIARQTLTSIAGDEAPTLAVDSRIQRAIEEIQRRLDEPLTLAEISAHVGLSEGRFRHLFVKETGVALRAFILWARLNRALALGYSGEASWTEAAHAANFADSAHLTRTCRRMFGITPASIRDSGVNSSAAQTA